MQRVYVSKPHGFNGSDLSEIYQTSGTRYALVVKRKNKLYTTTPLIKCRDFLSDAYLVSKKQKKASVYSFEYDPKDNILNRNTRLLVTHEFKYPYQDFGYEHVKKGLAIAKDVFVDIEQRLGLKKLTDIKKVELTTHITGHYPILEYTKCWLFTMSKFWSMQPYRLSLASLLIRICIPMPIVSLKKEDLFTNNIVNLIQGHSLISQADYLTLKKLKNYKHIVKILKSRKAKSIVAKRYEDSISLDREEKCFIINNSWHDNVGIDSILTDCS